MGSSQTVIPPPPDGFKLVDSGPPSPPAGFKLVQPEQPPQVPPPPPGFNLLDVAPAPVAPQNKPSTPIAGPTYNAPAKLPWYHELLNRIANVVAGPGAALNDTVGKLLNTAQPTQATWQPPTEKPILDLSALKAEQAVPGSGAASQVARGAVEGAENFGSGLTTPMNAALIAGTAGFGDALPVVSKLLSTGFSLQMLRSAFDQSPDFAKQVKAGDYEGAAKALTQIGLTAAAGTLAAKHAASPEGIAPIAADNVSRETAQQMAGNEGVTPEEAAADAASNTPGPYAQRYPENAPPPPPPPGFKLEQNPPSPRKAAPRPTVPEEGPSDAEQRLADARDRLAQSISGQPYEKLEPQDQTAIDDLAKQGYGHSVQPEAAQPEPATQNAPSFEGEKQEVEAPTELEATEAKPPRAPEKPVAYGAATQIRVPGEQTAHDAVYAVREASDVYPSHNPFSFEPNSDYYHRNDRNYAEPRNAERIVKQESEFDPAFMVNDNPDATNGPPIIDQDGNVLGGNSRAMTLARVNENRPEDAQAYKDLVVKQATRFGIPPKLVERMEHPMLVREVTGDVDPQQAITDFNKTGTAALTQSERAISDSKRLSSETADYLARRIDEQGPDGTLAQALDGTGGRDIVNRLTDDGVITAQEKPQLLNGDGSMTPEGKQRVGRLLSGQFFNSARDLEETAPELRAKLDRIVPSVMRTAQRPEWDITEPVKEAISLTKDAKARGVPVDDIVRQEGLFGNGGHSDEAVAIAKTLEKKPTEITRAFRQYASDEALSRPGTPMTMGFEPPDREEAFESAFGKPAAETPKDTLFAQAHGPATRQRPNAPTRTAPNPGQTAVTPSAGAQVANRWATFKDALLRLVAPAARTEGARETSYVMREMGGKLANRLDRAHEALKEGRKYFAARQPAENYDFIDRMESGRTQRTLAEQQIANTMRQMMDQARDAVQALGTGKLQNFYENYFPHIWEKPAAARDFFTQFIQKRPLQGSRAFTKQRSLVTFKDGLDAGFKPVSDNPVDLVLAKMHEMNKYVLAHD